MECRVWRLVRLSQHAVTATSLMRHLSMPTAWPPGMDLNQVLTQGSVMSQRHTSHREVGAGRNNPKRTMPVKPTHPAETKSLPQYMSFALSMVAESTCLRPIPLCCVIPWWRSRSHCVSKSS